MLDHILVPLDGSSLAECVLPHVVALAQVFNSQVTLLNVLEQVQQPGRPRSTDPVGWHIIKAEAQAYLDDVAGRLQAAGVFAQTMLMEGHPAECIIEYAHDNAVSLVVLSSHGRSGLSGWNVSGVVQKVVLRVYRPTLLVRAYQPALLGPTGLRYRRLLVPLDGSQRAEYILPLACNLALAHEAQMILAHVVHRPEMPRHAPLTQEETDLIEEIVERNRAEAVRYLDQLRSWLPCDVQTRLLISGSVTMTLHDLVEQEQVDLVLMSAHGYSAETRWPYGSKAGSFIAFGTTPLLIVQDVPLEDVEPSKAEMAEKAIGER